MSKEIFLNSFKIVIKEITQNIDITKISSTDFRNVKLYMINNPDDNDVVTAKNTLARLYASQFLNQELINAFNISNDLPYLKKQEIFKNLPFIHTQQNYRTYIYQLFDIPSEHLGSVDCFYKPIFWFIKTVDNSLLSDELINTINTFILENTAIFHIGIDEYDDYSIEIERYKKAINNDFNIDDYKDFELAQRVQRMITDNDVKIMYKNKKLGTIGELAVFRQLKDFNKVCFVAKELGNGFGYDIYFQGQDNSNTEFLGEVKTTANISDDDYFSLSENEYDTMINAIRTNNTKYIIFRVNAHNIDNLQYTILEAINEYVLKSENIEYHLDKCIAGHYYFRKIIIDKKLNKKE